MATWISHRLFNLSLGLFIGYDFVNSAILTLTATLNDRLDSKSEILVVGGRELRKHRGFFHDWSVWLFLSTAVYFLVPPLEFRELLFYPEVLFLGPFFHCILDSLSPFGTTFFFRRVRFKVYRTYGLSEYLFVSAVASSFLLLRFYFGLSFFELIQKIPFPF